MREWLKKLQIKGFVIGVLVTIMLSGTLLVAANTQTVTRDITYGIRVMLNGEIVQFDEESRPFVMGNRTFLPIRALAELLDLPVDFDPVANMAILGRNTAAPVRVPLQTAAPFHSRGSNLGWSSNSTVGLRQSWVGAFDVSMGGTSHPSTIVYATNFANHGEMSNAIFSLHNLNRQYTWLSGYAGRADNSELHDATISIYGDNRLLFTQHLRAGDLPIPVSVFVEGISLLRIEFTYSISERPFWNEFISYGFAGFVE